MKIIDFQKKGNVVRFYLGNDDLAEWYGDDWNDRPYEHNAGTVYDEFVEATIDVAFPFDWYVIEPQDDWCYNHNTEYCKDDFVARNAPCIVVVPIECMDMDELNYGMNADSYRYWAASDNAWKIYYGDSVDTIRNGKYSGEFTYTWTVG